MVRKQRSALLPTNTALLQNMVKRDPVSYKEEFLLQFRHYESLKDIFLQNPSASDHEEEFCELVGFVSQVCTCYPKETADFPQQLMDLLKDHHNELGIAVKDKIVQSLVMLKNKSVIDSEALVAVLFPLLISTESKMLRSQIYASTITLMKTANQNAKNQKLNRFVQALLFNLLADEHANGLWATKITRELWRRGVWDDSRTVEIMSHAATHPTDIKVACSAARFFIGADKERDEAQDDDEDDSTAVDLDALKHRLQINKKTGKRARKMEQSLKQYKKQKKHHSATYLNFTAIQLLRDPQGFADKLFSQHLGRGGSRLNLEQKILFVNLVSRMVGTHKLTVLSFYSFLLKYLSPKQTDVTQFLAAAAQASHDMVPPEIISPVIRKIADEFVSDGVAAEVAAAGINSIREIVSRAPLAIEKDLLQDLTEYKGSKSKPVMMAARSLISLFREIDPSLLTSKDRGKAGTLALKEGSVRQLQFGVSNDVNQIDGLELLAKWKAENEGAEAIDEDAAWEVASDESDSDSDDGEWITVESDKEYDVSDSDDEDKDGEKEEKTEEQKKAEAEEKAKKILELASTTVLTPADFAKIEELKMQAGVEKLMGIKSKTDETVDASALLGGSKFKQLREEKIAAAKAGKEGRQFGSSKGKQKDGNHSSTNKEKARRKNFMMQIHKRDVQGKARRSLRDKQKSLRAHIDKQKKKGY